MQTMQNILCSFIVFVAITTTLPSSGNARRMVYIGGFYGSPLKSDSFVPQEAISTFVSGDTIATNSHIGIFGPAAFDDEEDEEEEEKDGEVQDGVTVDVKDKRQELESETNQTAHTIQQDKPEEQITTTNSNNKDEVYIEAELSTTTVKPKVITKINRKKNRIPVVHNEDNNWPFQLGHNGGAVPSYNTFFPITLGAGGQSKFKSSGSEDLYPGAATAIANSFSTGKGGVASSQATSFGDPNIASFLRSNFHAKSAKKE